MPKLSDIYGTDETSIATRVSSDALATSAGEPDRNDSKTDSRADSSGGIKNDKVNDANVQVGARDDGRKNDSRARTEGNHGKQG